jgi:hypothetical protein
MYESARRQQANDLSDLGVFDTQNGLNECLACDSTESDDGKARSTEMCLRTQHTWQDADCCQQCDVGPCFKDVIQSFFLIP